MKTDRQLASQNYLEIVIDTWSSSNSGMLLVSDITVVDLVTVLLLFQVHGF